MLHSHAIQGTNTSEYTTDIVKGLNSFGFNNRAVLTKDTCNKTQKAEKSNLSGYQERQKKRQKRSLINYFDTKFFCEIKFVFTIHQLLHFKTHVLIYLNTVLY